MDKTQDAYFKELALENQTRNLCYIGSVRKNKGVAVYKLRQGGTDFQVWGCVVSQPGEPILIRFFKVAKHAETQANKKIGFMLNLVQQAMPQNLIPKNSTADPQAVTTMSPHL